MYKRRRDDMVMEPKISVIVATFRRCQSLITALNSLAMQTYQNFEIILVDDNDDLIWNKFVVEAVEEFKKHRSNVTINLIINHPNKGSAGSRNVGIDAAKGEYITFLDDDDIYLPNKLVRQVTAIRKSNADFGITDLLLYNEKDKLIETRTHDYILNTDMVSLLNYHLKYHLTGTDTMMFKTSYLHSIGGFTPIDVGDEFYLMQKAILGKGKFNYLPYCDVKAYVHTGKGGLSSGESKINGENQLYLFKQRYYGILNRKSKRYIRMRHYAVLAFAGLRMQRPFYTLQNGIASFISAPIECIKLCLERKK